MCLKYRAQTGSKLGEVSLNSSLFLILPDFKSPEAVVYTFHSLVRVKGLGKLNEAMCYAMQGHPGQMES